MKCNQPHVTTPVDFSGESLNIQIDTLQGKVWVCIDGVAVFRAKIQKGITIGDLPMTTISDAVSKHLLEVMG